MKLNWFQRLFCFSEPTQNVLMKDGYSCIHEKFRVDMMKGILVRIQDEENLEEKTFQIGHFSTPSISVLYERLKGLKIRYDLLALEKPKGNMIAVTPSVIKIEAIKVDGILPLHAQYPNAIFQAASQFNCLEFPSFHATPENGITFYCTDPTQGPACAIACAAGTLFRNYFVKVPAYRNDLSSVTDAEIETARVGQYTDAQINNLDGLEKFIAESFAAEDPNPFYWEIRNGYSFARPEDLTRLNELLLKRFSEDPSFRLQCIRHMKVGLHHQVGVTFNNHDVIEERDIRVTQVYCSALSCRYSGVPNHYWEHLARIVLEGMYEGTILLGMIEWFTNQIEQLEKVDSPVQDQRNNFRNQVFLTFLGGGVFGNESTWIAEAIGRSSGRVQKAVNEIFDPESLSVLQGKNRLHVNVCHYRTINSELQQEIISFYEHELKLV